MVHKKFTPVKANLMLSSSGFFYCWNDDKLWLISMHDKVWYTTSSELVTVTLFVYYRKADLLAVNADGNMPYDICEDEGTLEYLETQMANQGVTQELIDETRLSIEKKMLNDVREYEREGNSPSSWRDRSGATLVCKTSLSSLSLCTTYTTILYHYI